MLVPASKIYCDASKNPGAGRGVFASQDIFAGEVIEVCPVVEFTIEDSRKLRETELRNYHFMWGEDDETEQVAVCLGFGSLYNHSYQPNTTYKKRIDARVIAFVALRAIPEGEEITVNYNHGNPNDKSPLWIPGIKSYWES